MGKQDPKGVIRYETVSQANEAGLRNWLARFGRRRTSSGPPLAEQLENLRRFQEASAKVNIVIGAQGYGLDDVQQKHVADLWAWQRESLRSEIVLGGPLDEGSKP